MMFARRSGDSVFVPQGHHAYTIIRSLSKAGLRVDVGDAIHQPFGLSSKHVNNFVLYPDPDGTQDFVEALAGSIQELGSKVLIPCSTDMVAIISSHARQFKSITSFLIPPPDSLRVAIDKLETLKAARRVGIGAPHTREFTSPDDADHFPLVSKPRFETGGAKGMRILYSKKDAEDAFELRKEVGPLLLQEYVPGTSKQMRCCGLLFNQISDLKAVFTMRKISEFPSGGGTTLAGVSSWDPDIAELAIKLLSSISWRGVAEVEFKIDPKDGLPKLMEINPRFWAYLELPIRCGVDFPYLLYKSCLGIDFEMVGRYETGVGFVNARRKPLRSLKGFFSVPREKGLVFDMLDLHDPSWSLSAALIWINRRLLRNRRVRGKIARRLLAPKE